MEGTPLIARPLLGRAKSAEVCGGLWYVLVKELEDDSSGRTCAGRGIRAKMDGKRVMGREGIYHQLQ